MHSRIIELSDKPLKREEYAKEYDIPEWFCGYIADYVDLIVSDSERDESINWIASFLGASFKEGRMVITKEAASFFLSYRLEEFVKNVKELQNINTLEEFLEFSTGYKMHLLNGAYDDKYGFWVLYMGDFLTIDQFMRYVYSKVKEDKADELIFYTGSIWDFHM